MDESRLIGLVVIFVLVILLILLTILLPSLEKSKISRYVTNDQRSFREKCDNNSQCQSGLCSGGLCLSKEGATCIRTEDCLRHSNLTCVESIINGSITGICKKTDRVGIRRSGICNEPYINDYNGICVSPEGEECIKADDCLSRICEYGKCVVPSQQHEGCNRRCADGLECFRGVVCEPSDFIPGVLGASCMTNHPILQCDPGLACGDDDICIPLETHILGECDPGSCPKGTICSANGQSGVKNCITSGGICSSDQGCLGSDTCISGICKNGTFSALCAVGSQCISGTCLAKPSVHIFDIRYGFKHIIDAPIFGRLVVNADGIHIFSMDGTTGYINKTGVWEKFTFPNFTVMSVTTDETNIFLLGDTNGGERKIFMGRYPNFLSFEYLTLSNNITNISYISSEGMLFTNNTGETFINPNETGSIGLGKNPIFSAGEYILLKANKKIEITNGIKIPLDNVKNFTAIPTHQTSIGLAQKEDGNVYIFNLNSTGLGEPVVSLLGNYSNLSFFSDTTNMFSLSEYRCT